MTLLNLIFLRKLKLQILINNFSLNFSKSISPSAVRTGMLLNAGLPESIYEKIPILETKDVLDAIIYVLSTPPNVQVNIANTRLMHEVALNLQAEREFLSFHIQNIAFR